MKRGIEELENIHKGRDIWVIASGASMDFVAPSFFEGKITIGVNEVYTKFKCNYLVRKENKWMEDAYKTGIKLIVAEYDCGGSGRLNEIVDGDYWFFKHLPNKGTKIDFSIFGTDKIVVSYSTITSAIHIAAYMGARNIIICGHDCGTLDNNYNFKEYRKIPVQGVQGYLNWLKIIEDQTTQVKEKLREVYGCNIYSLNPFVSLNLEGHEFK